MAAKYAEGGVFGKLLRDPQFWAPLAATGVSMGVGAAASAVKSVVDAKAKARAFKDMLDMHPELKRRSHDQPFMGRVFNSIHAVNPELARDPMVAGAVMNNVIEMGGLSDDSTLRGAALLTQVRDMAQIRSQMSQAASRDGSMPRMLASASGDMVKNTFGRMRELEKEHGALASEQKDNRRLREELRTKLMKDTVDIGERFERLRERNPEAANKILEAALNRMRHFSAEKTSSGQRLIKAIGRR